MTYRGKQNEIIGFNFTQVWILFSESVLKIAAGVKITLIRKDEGFAFI
ncbi:MAG: hypothetical protein IKH65_00780 [Clostridia bacterium]|nr:hypothetical protein [Clostridia bacterium]